MQSQSANFEFIQNSEIKDPEGQGSTALIFPALAFPALAYPALAFPALALPALAFPALIYTETVCSANRFLEHRYQY